MRSPKDEVEQLLRQYAPLDASEESFKLTQEEYATVKKQAYCAHDSKEFRQQVNLILRQQKRTGRKGGKKVTCPDCGAVINLKLRDIAGVRRNVRDVLKMCDLVKMLGNGSEKDNKLILNHVSPVQHATSAYLAALYEDAARRLQQDNAIPIVTEESAETPQE